MCIDADQADVTHTDANEYYTRQHHVRRRRPSRRHADRDQHIYITKTGGATSRGFITSALNEWGADFY